MLKVIILRHNLQIFFLLSGPLLVFQDSFSAERNSYPFINYRGNPETLTFEILTYEIPNQYTFVFLGMDPRAVIGLFPRLDVLKYDITLNS